MDSLPKKEPQNEELADLRVKLALINKALSKMTEEETEKENTPLLGVHEPNNQSRRTFLKKAGLITLGVAGLSLKPSKIGTETKKLEPKNPESKTKEQIIQTEIAECSQIIIDKRYEDVITKPYLVSALYYSDSAMKKIGETDQDAHKDILSAIYPLITKEFREQYLLTLEKEFYSGQKEVAPGSNKDHSPLGRFALENRGKNHEDAIDLFIKEGSPIYSVTDGLVVLAENGWDPANQLSTSSMRGGNTVIIFNPHNKQFYRYAHMFQSTVSAGAILTSGEKIGVVGHTGINASKKGHGQHVHFEINQYNSKNGIMSVVDRSHLHKILKGLKK